ncbi:hypothetical protein [Propionivibrio dicarboxylicus]|uniref:Uncharacterized protein n=1 Tax=Propionivibrio dicarboxylicus TaxID=83767 RepID=A0A1G8A6C2_9RHOO|nr:hypothetical protein [Propionivibrio dicarboxylicus]SDH16406.1 hypothetical protein SAMN05660652_01294 [Propionivibrio dicarboxylicus]
MVRTLSSSRHDAFWTLAAISVATALSLSLCLVHGDFGAALALVAVAALDVVAVIAGAR